VKKNEDRIGGNIEAGAASEQVLEEASVCSSWWLQGVSQLAEWNKGCPHVSAEVIAVLVEGRSCPGSSRLSHWRGSGGWP